jgi:lipopolysaccharide transport system ATP-binding protein
MSSVLRVENISKMYRLGEVSTGALVHDVNRWWHKIRGKEDPYISVAQANARETKGSSDYVWALKDISFEVQQGDVLGIIGRNGAGKSTLLKILSRITAPTTGKIKVRGRIASLLEVGTGFHPELTGRENIYLNGAILGMTKAEINRKFNEIVDFSGVERYIDTPVKRYSSGMYVRLAFAVAAHLESEILIIDEVLAVGDAEFQKKCLGKMKDVSSNEGRTVLFVSHNMAAVKGLCNKGVVMISGEVALVAPIDESVSYYLSNYNKKRNTEVFSSNNRRGNGKVRFLAWRIADCDGIKKDIVLSGDCVQFFYKIRKNVPKVENVFFWMQILRDGEICCTLHTDLLNYKLNIDENDDCEICCIIDKFPFFHGNYHVNLLCKVAGDISDYIDNAFDFTVENGDFYGTGVIPHEYHGIMTDHKWGLNRAN